MAEAKTRRSTAASATPAQRRMMADRLVHVQYEFIREVVASAGKGLSRARTQANRAPTAVDHRTRLGGCSIR